MTTTETAADQHPTPLDTLRPVRRPILRPSLRRALVAPLRSPLRWPAAAAALVVALAHVPVVPDHLDEVPYLGWLFVGLVAASVLGSAALLVRDSPLAWALVATCCLAALVAYAVSRTLGLPGASDDIGDWTDPFGLISVSSEALTVVLAAAVAVRRRRDRPLSPASNG